LSRRELTLKIILTEDLPWKPVAVNARVGEVQSKYVREGEIPPGVGYAADCYNYTSGNNVFTAPGHHHDLEQIRISMTGVQDFGQGQIIEEGWIAYFPAGAYDGPERIDDASIFQIQWSDFWVSRAERERAYRELAERGEFTGARTDGPTSTDCSRPRTPSTPFGRTCSSESRSSRCRATRSRS
jgi:hypothetical protein